MVDYHKDTGSSGTMRIRDTGSVVEFWINAGNSSTFNHDMPWGYTVNGSTNNNREYDYKAGSGWEKLGAWTVTTDQTVTFRLFDTGTSGLGGPTTFSVFIDRASVPSPPTVCTISSVTANSVFVTFGDGASNGAAIDARQIGYGTSSTNVQHTVSSDKSTTVSGLSPGTTYYFWARTHNAKGWSAWGPRTSKTTLKAPDAPNPPVVSDPTQTTVVASFTDNGNGGSAILERQIGYGTSPSAPSASVTYSGVTTITGLQPATTYYFWSRVRNATGWSAYSASRTARTIAGAFVKVGAEYKEAIPYVKDGGVWKLARPYSRIAGVWKVTK